ncbi:uncharacterized protein LOC126793736 [Argentina anserina]|uniref:uncharacterized protein LOC126793736 n=1 Tax=Argentina anserina TaxID=57926 RepID=UPI00217628EF|nr:uncharacterized protein LOC126793736 [Potentilla anserina]
MEAEECPTTTDSAIVAVTTAIESAIVTVAATGSSSQFLPDKFAVTGGCLSDELKQNQIVSVASKMRPRKKSMAAQTGGKKPRKRTKSMAAQIAEAVTQYIADPRRIGGNPAENEEVTLVTASSTGTESDDVVPVTEESKKRKNGPGKRGPSTGSKAEQIRISTGHKIAVNLDPEHGRPIDKGVSSLLSNECGKIVREKCPMVHETWTKITRDVKHNLRKEVEVNFDVDVQRPSIVHYLNKLMGKVYREFKCELHKHYKKMRSLEEALDKPPKAMIARNDPAQWKCLCKHFSEEKFKKKSETNAKNRAGKEYEHCGGSRPHGLYFQDKVQEGSKFPAIETFRVTHLKKGSNEWISNKAQEQYDKMILKEEAYLQVLAEKHPGVPIKELPITPEVGIEILKEVLSVKPKQPVRGLGTFWVNENPTSSIIEELEEVYAELERERAIRTKIQGMLNAAYERLGQLDPDFEPPQLHLVDPNIEAPQLDLNGVDQHQTH